MLTPGQQGQALGAPRRVKPPRRLSRPIRGCRRNNANYTATIMPAASRTMTVDIAAGAAPRLPAQQ